MSKTFKDDIEKAVKSFLENGGSAICDVHISDKIASPQIQSHKPDKQVVIKD